MRYTASERTSRPKMCDTIRAISALDGMLLGGPGGPLFLQVSASRPVLASQAISVRGDAVVAWLVRLARLGLERLTYYPVLIQ